MIRAILFDLDGTLVDTEPLHFAAFSEVLQSQGIALAREDYFKRLIGFTDRECLTLLLKENNRNTDQHLIAKLTAAKAERYVALISTGRDLLYPGAERFVRQCASRFPLLLVTGTLRAEAQHILKHAALVDLFVDIVAAEDVERGKPEPDSYLAALGRLGFCLRLRPPIGPNECLVVEDTAAGIEAARRAGMKVLAIAHTAAAIDLAGADLVRDSFSTIDLDDVLRRA